jgi:hypothetical protein
LSLEEENARKARVEKAERVRQNTEKEAGLVRRKTVAKVKNAAASPRPLIPDLIDLTSSGQDGTRGISPQQFQSVQAFNLAVELSAEQDLIDLAFPVHDKILDTRLKPFEQVQASKDSRSFVDIYYAAISTPRRDQYIYEPLREDDIRLLILHPKQKSQITSSIECVIIHVSLRDRKIPEYEALSYCWGKSSVTHVIQLGGKQMTVGENLWVALQNLREASEGKERRLWVDAICS